MEELYLCRVEGYHHHLAFVVVFLYQLYKRGNELGISGFQLNDELYILIAEGLEIVLKRGDRLTLRNVFIAFYFVLF